MEPTIVLTTPRSLSESALAAVRRDVDAWRAAGFGGVMVLQDGMQASLIGGLDLRIALVGGPLDQVTFGIKAASLDGIPESLAYGDVTYSRYVVDGQQFHTTDGAICYRVVSDA